MAPLTSRPKDQEDLAAAAPVIAPADRLSALPSDVLPQILSCLPAQEALRTCVLARTWRNLWKEKRFPRCLLITAAANDPAVQQDIPGFIDRLLDLRLREIKEAPLESCEISFGWYYDEEIPSLSSWTRRALECQILVLRVHLWTQLCNGYPYFHYASLTRSKPLASQNLTRLELAGILFDEMGAGKLDFSSCPALEDMELADCLSNVVMISPSLKRLTFRRCKFFDGSRIRVPCLKSLWLEDLTGRGPQLESMPELAVAYVYISHYYDGSDNESSSSDPGVTDDDSEWGSSDDAGADSENGVVLASDNGDNHSRDDAEAETEKYFLGGLSEARNLTLISEDNTYVMRSDLQWCPTFHKLKTLVLNDHWCKPVDCTPLACILEHTPVLEKLTIEFSQQIKRNYKVEMKAHRHATEESTMISQHLKIIKIKCQTINETILNVLNFMGTHNISFQFSIRQGSN